MNGRKRKFICPSLYFSTVLTPPHLHKVINLTMIVTAVVTYSNNWVPYVLLFYSIKKIENASQNKRRGIRRFVQTVASVPTNKNMSQRTTSFTVLVFNEQKWCQKRIKNAGNTTVSMSLMLSQEFTKVFVLQSDGLKLSGLFKRNAQRERHNQWF